MGGGRDGPLHGQMKWLRGTYTQRNNSRHELRGDQPDEAASGIQAGADQAQTGEAKGRDESMKIDAVTILGPTPLLTDYHQFPNGSSSAKPWPRSKSTSGVHRRIEAGLPQNGREP